MYAICDHCIDTSLSEEGCSRSSRGLPLRLAGSSTSARLSSTLLLLSLRSLEGVIVVSLLWSSSVCAEDCMGCECMNAECEDDRKSACEVHELA